jgi:hypothetical protein
VVPQQRNLSLVLELKQLNPGGHVPSIVGSHSNLVLFSNGSSNGSCPMGQPSEFSWISGAGIGDGTILILAVVEAKVAVVVGMVVVISRLVVVDGITGSTESG